MAMLVLECVVKLCQIWFRKDLEKCDLPDFLDFQKISHGENKRTDTEILIFRSGWKDYPSVAGWGSQG